MTKKEQKEMPKAKVDFGAMFCGAIRWDKVDEAIKKGALSVDKNGNLKVGN